MLLALAASSGLSRSTTPGSTPCCTAMRYRQSPSFTTYPPGTGPRSATASAVFSNAPFVVVVGAAPMGACAESGGGGSGRGGGPWDLCGFGCECDRSECGGVAGMRWGLGREEADAEPARDRKPLPSRWSRSILACADGSIESGGVWGVSAEFRTSRLVGWREGGGRERNKWAGRWPGGDARAGVESRERRRERRRRPGSSHRRDRWGSWSGGAHQDRDGDDRRARHYRPEDAAEQRGPLLILAVVG